MILGVVIMFASLWGNAWLFVNLPQYELAALLSGLLGMTAGWAITGYAFIEMK